jgi:benzil reductase ((S)-benzoin forming)
MNLYIVTGTTRGLGAALARRIALDPSNELVAIDRGQADFADGAAVERACDEIERRIAGKAYAKAVLINNAGIVAPVAPLDRADAGEIERNLTVNLIAPMRLMGRFIRMTPAVPVRRVINISSGAGRRPVFGWGAYCAAKAGLDMASRVLALEAETRGLALEVSSLAPGVIDTPMQETLRASNASDFVDIERFRAMKAEGTLRPPDEVAADILRLEAAGKLRGDPVQDLRQLA